MGHIKCQGGPCLAQGPWVWQVFKSKGEKKLYICHQSTVLKGNWTGRFSSVLKKPLRWDFKKRNEEPNLLHVNKKRVRASNTHWVFVVQNFKPLKSPYRPCTLNTCANTFQTSGNQMSLRRNPRQQTRAGSTETTGSSSLSVVSFRPCALCHGYFSSLEAVSALDMSACVGYYSLHPLAMQHYNV